MEPLITNTKSSNKEELLKVFREIISQEKLRLFEIGTGSGHHAVHIAKQFPNLQWVTSDLLLRHNAIKKTLKEAKLPNVHGPLAYEVGKDEFPSQKFNAAFASQLLHAISWKQAKTLMKQLGGRLRQGSPVIFYGPFKYNDKFESSYLEKFDQDLKLKDQQLGIRAFEDVSKAMAKAGFILKKDFSNLGEYHVLFFERLEHIKDV
jgi:SAM-dependent MidA family methyltransferase